MWVFPYGHKWSSRKLGGGFSDNFTCLLNQCSLGNPFPVFQSVYIGKEWLKCPNIPLLCLAPVPHRFLLCTSCTVRCLLFFFSTPFSSFWQTSSLYLHCQAHLRLRELKAQTKTDLCLEVSIPKEWKEQKLCIQKAVLSLTINLLKCFLENMNETLPRKQMIARLRLFASGLWYCLLCQFWEYEVSYDNDDMFPLEGQSIGFIYGVVVYVMCILFAQVWRIVLII